MTRGHNVSFETDLKSFFHEKFIKKFCPFIPTLYKISTIIHISIKFTDPTPQKVRLQLKIPLYRLALIQFELRARRCIVGTFNDRIQ